MSLETNATTRVAGVAPDHTAPVAVAEASWAFFPGAGGGGQTWKPIADRFGATVSVLPGLDSVPAIADELEPQVRALPGPRILVGNSLGAMVALELARRIDVAGLMLVAAGWDFPVSDELIRRVDALGPAAFESSARRSVGQGSSPGHLEAIVADFRSRQPGTMGQHLRAIRDHQPAADTRGRPVTLVMRGGCDRSVALKDHLVLAERTGGALVSIPTAAHMPFVDHAAEIVAWLHRLRRMVAPA